MTSKLIPSPSSYETSMWKVKVHLTFFAVKNSVNLIFIKPCYFEIPLFSVSSSFLLKLLTKAAAPFRTACLRMTQERPTGKFIKRGFNVCRVRFLVRAVGSETQDLNIDVSPAIRRQVLARRKTSGAEASLKVPSF